MKKITFLFFLVLFKSTLFAQTTGNYGDYKKWSYGIIMGVTSNFRILKSNGTGQLPADAQNEKEIRHIAFTAGITVNYRITDAVSINSGLACDDLGFKTRDQLLSFSDGASITTSTAYHYHYVSLPLDLKYGFMKKAGWVLHIGGGIAPAVFIGETTTFNYGGSKNIDKQSVGYDRFNLVGDLRTGADYWITDKIKLTAGLYYKQFLNATNSNLPTKAYLNAAGLTAGFVYARRKKLK